MNTAGTPSTPPPLVNRLEPAAKAEVVVAPPARRRMFSPTAAMVALVLLGGGLRAAAMLSDRCLWIDESMLALNLVNRSPAQLLEPLDHNQGAPVGFLLTVKAAITALGASEWSLRLVPFLASLVGMVGFAWLARRLLPEGAAVLGVALFALSPHLISYAAECKQYACDAAICVGLFSASVGLLKGKGGRRWVVLALAGAVAVWCSHPAAFVLGGIGGALLLHAAVMRDRAKFLSASLTVGCWLTSFGLCYILCLKQLGGNKYLTDYWTDHFLPLSPGAVSWVADHLVAFFTVPGGFGGLLVPMGGLAAMLALVGPVGVLLFASALHKYPFGGRLLLFLVPVATLLVARGAWALFEAARERNRFAAASLLVLLVGAGVWQSQDALRRPARYEQLPPVLDELRAGVRPGDQVFVYWSAVPAFTFYTREHPLPAGTVILGEEHRDDPGLYREEAEKLRGRVWVVFSHPHNQEETTLRTTLDCHGTCEREVKRTGAAVWLYRLE